MEHIVAVLTAVAITLTGQQVTLTCGPIPSDKPEIREHAVGIVTPDINGGPPNITMLPWVCRSANRREHFGLMVLAHEILHVRPNRTEEWTRMWDDWYAENVVRWKVKNIQRQMATRSLAFLSANTILARNPGRVSMVVTNSRASIRWNRGKATICCAVNAKPPDPNSPQIRFRVDFGKSSTGVCLKPRLSVPMVAKVCRAPDGSYWALQKWERLWPNYGGNHADVELWPSHWKGELPKFENVGWHIDGGGTPVLDGKLTYQEKPVFGFTSTSSGVPTDTYGRLVYLDAYNSDFGSGWRRVNSFLTHTGTGEFHYIFAVHNGHRGLGEKYRITASGPGVTPIIRMAVANP